MTRQKEKKEMLLAPGSSLEIFFKAIVMGYLPESEARTRLEGASEAELSALAFHPDAAIRCVVIRNYPDDRDSGLRNLIMMLALDDAETGSEVVEVVGREKDFKSNLLLIELAKRRDSIAKAAERLLAERTKEWNVDQIRFLLRHPSDRVWLAAIDSLGDHPAPLADDLMMEELEKAVNDTTGRQRYEKIIKAILAHPERSTLGKLISFIDAIAEAKNRATDTEKLYPGITKAEISEFVEKICRHLTGQTSVDRHLIAAMAGKNLISPPTMFVRLLAYLEDNIRSWTELDLLEKALGIAWSNLRASVINRLEAEYPMKRGSSDEAVRIRNILMNAAKSTNSTLWRPAAQALQRLHLPLE